MSFREKGKKRSPVHSFYDVISLLESATTICLLIGFRWDLLQMIKEVSMCSDTRKPKMRKFSTFRVEPPLKFVSKIKLHDHYTASAFIQVFLYTAFGRIKIYNIWRKIIINSNMTKDKNLVSKRVLPRP